jgi:hypothetical protein
MRALHLAIQPRCPRLDVVVADALVQDVVVEQGLELGAVVGLDDLDPEREALQDVVDELDGCLLVELGVDAQDPQAGAVVDGGELVVLAARARPCQGRDELHVQLHPVARQGLLLPLPAPIVALVPLGGRQPIEVQALRGPATPLSG